MQALSYAITADISGQLYDWFAHVALLFFLVVLCYEGNRRKFPAASWLLILAIIVTAALIGSRIAIFDVASWQSWWQQGIFPEATERTSIGVVLFLFPAVWLIKKGLRFQAPFLDTLAFALPVVVIIRRLGCLAAACCYGIPTGGDWGLRYLGPSAIRDHHWAEQVLGADRFGSALVHPVQLYFIIAAVVTLWLLQKNKTCFKRAGNLTLFSIALLLGFRFFIEFFRDPATSHQLGTFVFGLKQIQWFCLVSVLLLISAIYIREKKPSTYNNTVTNPSFVRVLIGNLLLVACVFWMQDTFTLSEKVGIHTFIGLSGIALLVEAIKNRAIQKSLYVWQKSLLVLLALFMMSQSYPDNMSDIKEGKKRTLHANYNYLNTNEPTYNCINVESGCGGNYCALADSLNPNGAQYQQFNIGYNSMDFYTKPKRRVRPGTDSTITAYYEFGFDLQPEFFYDKANDHHSFRGNVMPYVGWGDSFIGLRAGLRLGSIWGHSFGEGITKGKAMILSGSMRVGSPDRLYFLFESENSMAAGASVSGLEVSCTLNMSDYTNNRWEYLRIGFGDIYYNASRIYVEPAFNFNERLFFTPRFGFTFRSEKDNDFRKAFNHPSVGVGLQYRLN